MAETFRVRIDIDKLAENITEGEGKQCTSDDAVQFLTDNGFVPVAGGY